MAVTDASTYPNAEVTVGMNPDVSILIPWKPDGSDRDYIFSWIHSRLRWAFPWGEVITGHNNEDPFNRSAARNDAFRKASGDVVIFADADTTLGDTSLYHEAVTIVAEDPSKWVIPYAENRYYNMARGASHEIMSTPSWVKIDDPDDENAWEHKITSWAGALVMHRSAFEAVNGYDERFHGWGGEDNAFQYSMDTLVSPHIRLDGACYHLWHPRGEADFDQPDWPENKELLKRYERARGSPSRMKRLVDEDDRRSN